MVVVIENILNITKKNKKPNGVEAVGLPKITMLLKHGQPKI